METRNVFASTIFCNTLMGEVMVNKPLFDIAAKYNIHPIISDILDAGYIPGDMLQLIREYPHVSNTDPGMIAYYQTPEKLEKCIATKTRPGKYFRRLFPEMPDTVIRHYSNLCEPVFIKWLSGDEMVKFMENGADGITSCMAKSFCEDHPYNVYAPEYGWKMGVMKKGTETVARALVNEVSRTFVRTYSTSVHNGYNQESEKFASMLNAAGYSRANGWAYGLKLRKIKTRRGIVGPYIDGYNDRAEDMGNHLVISQYGEYLGGNTTGYFQDGYDHTCSDCGNYFDIENEGLYIDHSDRHVCNYCANNYVYIDYRGQRRRYTGYFIHYQDAVECQDNSRMIDPDNPPDWAVMDYNGDWRHIDYLVYIESTGEYYDTNSDDICLANIGRGDQDYRLIEECFQCDYDGEWYYKNYFDYEMIDGRVICQLNVAKVLEEMGQKTLNI